MSCTGVREGEAPTPVRGLFLFPCPPPPCVTSRASRPQEYGMRKEEKLHIAQCICAPLLRKILGDLQHNVEEEESTRLDSRYPHTGYPHTGCPQTGYPHIGYPHTGYPHTGYPKTGYPQTGYPQTGYPQTGYPQTGYPQTGYPQTGSSTWVTGFFISRGIFTSFTLQIVGFEQWSARQVT